MSTHCEVIWGTFGCPFGLFFNDFGESVGCKAYATCVFNFLGTHELNAKLNTKWAESLGFMLALLFRVLRGRGRAKRGPRPIARNIEGFVLPVSN